MESRSTAGPVTVATAAFIAAAVNLGNAVGWWHLNDTAASSVNVLVYSAFTLIAALHAAAEPVQALKRKDNGNGHAST